MKLTRRAARGDRAPRRLALPARGRRQRQDPRSGRALRRGRCWTTAWASSGSLRSPSRRRPPPSSRAACAGASSSWASARRRVRRRRAWVSTIHGFCSRLLRANALAAGIDPEYRVLDEAAAARLSLDAFDRALEEFVLKARASGTERLDLVASYTPDKLQRMVTTVYSRLRSRGQRAPALPQIAEPVAARGARSARARAVCGRSRARRRGGEQDRRGGTRADRELRQGAGRGSGGRGRRRSRLRGGQARKRDRASPRGVRRARGCARGVARGVRGQARLRGLRAPHEAPGAVRTPLRRRQGGVVVARLRRPGAACARPSGRRPRAASRGARAFRARDGR